MEIGDYSGKDLCKKASFESGVEQRCSDACESGRDDDELVRKSSSYSFNKKSKRKLERSGDSDRTHM